MLFDGTMDRIKRLKNLIDKTPDNPFPRYGLAMEYKNQGDHPEAVHIFQELVEHHPNYTAAYFHFGMSLQAVGKQEEAQEILELGIKVAGKSGELHAQEELQSALKELCEDIPQ